MLYRLRSSRKEVNAQSVWTVNGQCAASAGNLVWISELGSIDREVGVQFDWRASIRLVLGIKGLLCCFCAPGERETAIVVEILLVGKFSA